MLCFMMLSLPFGGWGQGLEKVEDDPYGGSNAGILGGAFMKGSGMNYLYGWDAQLFAEPTNELFFEASFGLEGTLMERIREEQAPDTGTVTEPERNALYYPDDWNDYLKVGLRAEYYYHKEEEEGQGEITGRKNTPGDRLFQESVPVTKGKRSGVSLGYFYKKSLTEFQDGTSLSFSMPPLNNLDLSEEKTSPEGRYTVPYSQHGISLGYVQVSSHHSRFFVTHGPGDFTTSQKTRMYADVLLALSSNYEPLKAGNFAIFSQEEQKIGINTAEIDLNEYEGFFPAGFRVGYEKKYTGTFLVEWGIEAGMQPAPSRSAFTDRFYLGINVATGLGLNLFDRPEKEEDS